MGTINKPVAKKERSIFLAEEFFIPTGIGIKRFARETQNKAEPPFFLKEPLTVGTTWDDEDGTYEITALGKTISVPAGAFTHCLEVTNENADRTVVSRFIVYSIHCH